MNKNIKFIKGTFQTLFTSTFIIALLFAMSCDNGSDEPEPDTFAGTYLFHKATLQTDVSFTIDIVGVTIPVSIDKGKDITEELKGALLEEAPCDNEENGAIDLKENKELFFICIGESNELKAGTWDENADLTVLTLNLASPPLPNPIPLKIEDITVTGDIIAGSIIGFPLTQDLLAGFLPDGIPEALIPGIIAQLPAVIIVDIEIEFKKVAG